VVTSAGSASRPQLRQRRIITSLKAGKLRNPCAGVKRPQCNGGRQPAEQVFFRPGARGHRPEASIRSFRAAIVPAVHVFFLSRLYQAEVA
jgi:hypothetical protein